MPMPRDVFQLSDEQFGKLVELLTPGYECAKMMLADYQARSTPAEASGEIKMPPPNGSDTDPPPAPDPSTQGSG